MTFNSPENSLADGQPVRLYLFERGLTRWGYTDADRDITFETVTYRSLQISDAGIRDSGDPDADAFEITAPADLAPAQLYRGIAPTTEVFVTVRDTHYGESDAQISWMGSIYGVNWPAIDRCKITCQSIAASFEQPGLRLVWGRNCPYSLYDTDCRVNRDLYAVEAVIDSLNAGSIEVSEFAGFADGYFDGGYIEWPIGPALYERRGIESHVGSSAAMFGGTTGLPPGGTITAYPGCARIAQVCNDKFDNIENYGGDPHRPDRSPFDGNPVF